VKFSSSKSNFCSTFLLELYVTSPYLKLRTKAYSPFQSFSRTKTALAGNIFSLTLNPAALTSNLWMAFTANVSNHFFSADFGINI